MKIYTKIISEKLIDGKIVQVEKGQGTNTAMSIQVNDEDGGAICQLNVFYDVEGNQILTTFVPLNCLEYTKEGVNKLSKTKRYHTGVIPKGEKKKGDN